MRRIQIVISILFLVQPMVPALGGAADPVLSLLEQARLHYYQLHYSQSLEDIHRALAILDGRSRDDSIAPLYWRCWMQQALVNHSQGKKEAALHDLQMAFGLAADLRPEWGAYPPSFQKIFDEAQKGWLAQAMTLPLRKIPLAVEEKKNKKKSKGFLFGGLGVLGVGIFLATILTQKGSEPQPTGSLAIQFK